MSYWKRLVARWGSGAGEVDELVLRANTTYLRTITSGADDNLIQFRAAWYEHLSKN